MGKQIFSSTTQGGDNEKMMLFVEVTENACVTTRFYGEKAGYCRKG